MTLRNILLFFCILPVAEGLSQEVKLGINFSTNLIQRHTLEAESFTPNNSFYTYLPKELNSNFVIEQTKAFNSVSFGLNARVSRKKIGLVFEPQFTMEMSIFRFTSPYESNRILNRRAVRLPLNLTYHIIKNVNSPYLIGGVMLVLENNFDFQQLSRNYYFGSEDPYETNPDFGADHFDGVFYDGRARYNYVIGIGKKRGNLDLSARYVSTLTPNKYLGKKWQVELNIAYYFLSNKDLTRKNYLYEE